MQRESSPTQPAAFTVITPVDTPAAADIAARTPDAGRSGTADCSRDGRPRGLFASALQQHRRRASSRLSSRNSSLAARPTAPSSQPSDQLPLPAPPLPPSVRLAELASFNLDVNLDAWSMPDQMFKQRSWLTQRFADESVEAEFQRFQWHATSRLATALVVPIVAGIAALTHEAWTRAAIAAFLVSFVPLSVVVFATVAKALNHTVVADPSDSTMLPDEAAEAGNEEALQLAAQVSLQRHLSRMYEYAAYAILALLALVSGSISVINDIGCAAEFEMHTTGDLFVEGCRRRLVPGVFIVQLCGLFAIRATVPVQICFTLACAVAAVLGHLVRGGADPADGLNASDRVLLSLTYLGLMCSALPVAIARDIGLRNRFVLLVDVFLASDRIEHHQESIWSLVRAVVPGAILPRVRIASSGEAARIVDYSEAGVVAITGVHNFGPWSLQQLPFNVVLSLTRLFIEFDRCLANVDSAVIGKAFITGDKYVVVGGLAAIRSQSSTSSRRRSRSALPSPHASQRPGTARDTCAAELLVILDIAEEQIHQGRQLVAHCPEICRGLAVSAGVAVGSLYGGISGSKSLRYLVAGPALQEAEQLQALANPHSVAFSSLGRSALEDTFPSEVEWSSSDAPSTYEARRARRTPAYPGLHNVVIGSDLVGNRSPEMPSLGQSGTSLQQRHDEALPHPKNDREDAYSVASPEAENLEEAPDEGAEPAPSPKASVPPEATSAGDCPPSPKDASATTDVTRSTPTSSPRRASNVVVQRRHGGRQPSTEMDLVNFGTSGEAELPAPEHHGGPPDIAELSASALSQSSLLSSAAAEHRAHVADDRALEELLVQANEMLARDRCTGAFVHGEVEEALRRFAEEDDRRFAVPIALGASFATMIVLLAALGDEIATSTQHPHETEAPPAGNATGPVTSAAPLSAAEQHFTDHKHGDAFQNIQGLALLILATTLSLVRLIIAIVKRLRLPHIADFALCVIVCGFSSCAPLSSSEHNLITDDPTFMIPVYGLAIIGAASRPSWMAVSAAIVVSLGVPTLMAKLMFRPTQHPAVFVRLALYSTGFAVLAIGFARMLRTRFTAVLLAGEFLQLSKQRLMIRDELLRGLLPAHVMQDVSDTAEQPEEVRLMADRPHFLEVWEELVVVHVRFDGLTPSAPHISGSSAHRRHVDGEPSAFDIAAARLQDVLGAIAAAATTSADTAGGSVNLLDVVETLGDSIVVAGCLPPLTATPEFADLQARAKSTARAAVSFCRELAARAAQRDDACVAVAVVESGYGAVLGSQLLNYCVLGVARRTAAAVQKNLPDFGPPGSVRHHSVAFGLGSFVRLFERQLAGGRVLHDGDTKAEQNPLEGTPLPEHEDHPRAFGTAIRCGIRTVGSVELVPLVLDGPRSPQ